jgi:hypothetical protein
MKLKSIRKNTALVLALCLAFTVIGVIAPIVREQNAANASFWIGHLLAAFITAHQRAPDNWTEFVSWNREKSVPDNPTIEFLERNFTLKPSLSEERFKKGENVVACLRHKELETSLNNYIRNRLGGGPSEYSP